jgi:hypothetical protein
LITGLPRKGATKQYDKVLERVGRLKEKYALAAQYYDISVTKDGSSGKCVLMGSTGQNIIGLMQCHNFQLKELGIPETIGHFVLGFDLVVGAFKRSG